MSFRPVIRIGLPILAGAAIVAGFWWWDERREMDGCRYQFINPQRCEERLRITNPEYKATEQDILAKIDEWKERGVSSVAVHFRDLRNGPTITIDSNDAYLAMSLYKLPVLIRYLKDAESDPGLLDERVVGSRPEAVEDQGLPTEQSIVAGASYTIRELLEKLIWYSDNYSWNMLVEYYQRKHPDYLVVVDTLAELGIVDPETQPDPRLVSLRSVSSIFRALYNASYLNLEMSQYALELLSRSGFDKGISAPIPPSISVANKFGFSTENNLRQLHDCGIVYYPDHPYILCVLTKGSNTTVLEQTIASISQIVYTEVQRRFP